LEASGTDDRIGIVCIDLADESPPVPTNPASVLASDFGRRCGRV